jgi:hypothetical protein
MDKEIIRDWFIGLEALRGREPEDYAYLIEPFTEYVFNNGFNKIGSQELNKLVKGILTERPETTPTEIEPSVTAELLAEQIKPWVEDIRQKLFHSKSAPFRSVSDAKKWLDEVNRRIDEWHKRVDEWHKQADEWERRVDEWHKRNDAFHDYWQVILEKYPHITGGIEKWSLMKKQGIEVKLPTADEEQKLTELQLVVEALEVGEVGDPPEQDEQVKIYYALLDDKWEMCKVTGFTIESMEMCILADASPVLPPFTFGIVRETHSLPSGIRLQNRFAKVDIRGELSFQDLRSLHRSIRDALGIKRLKRPTTKHLQLYKMVTQRGNVPDGEGTVAFWKSIMEEWNDLYPQKKYKTWKGIKLAYERIIAQAERRMKKEEAQNERKHKAKKQK